MGFYVDLEMPKDCPMCPFAHYDIFNTFSGCDITRGKRWAVKNDKDYAESSTRPDWCPLIEVPEPHGRLIDAAEITEHKYTTIPSHRKEYADGKPKSDEEIIAFKFGWNYAIDAIVENAPTVIPASDKDINVLGKEEPTHSNASNTLKALREEGEI